MHPVLHLFVRGNGPTLHDYTVDPMRSKTAAHSGLRPPFDTSFCQSTIYDIVLTVHSRHFFVFPRIPGPPGTN